MNHLLATLVLATFPGATSMAEVPAPLVEAIRIARDQDTFAAFEDLEANGSPKDHVAHYSKAVFVLYDLKDVPLMVAFGRRGIQLALEASRAEGLSDEERADLRGSAKVIAYNVGANTWPGWNDDGITISRTDLALGLDSAKLDLRLAVELKRPADKLSAAHWLLGAQQMANGDAASGRASFLEAAELAGEAGKPVEKQMNLGYAALAGMLDAKTRSERIKEFEAAVQSLRDEGSDDGKFFAGQLETARSVFVKDPS